MQYFSALRVYACVQRQVLCVCVYQCVCLFDRCRWCLSFAAGKLKGTIRLTHDTRLHRQQGAGGTNFKVATPGRTYRLVADTPADMDDWLNALKTNIAIIAALHEQEKANQY